MVNFYNLFINDISHLSVQFLIQVLKIIYHNQILLLLFSAKNRLMNSNINLLICLNDLSIFSKFGDEVLKLLLEF